MRMLSVLVLLLASVGSALAGPASEMVRSRQTALLELLRQKGPDLDREMKGLFDEMLDSPAMAEASLGSAWASRSDAERARFADLLDRLVRQAYARNLAKILNHDVAYVGEQAAGAATKVQTRAVPKGVAGAEPVEITFVVSEKGGAWKVQDLVIEGVSLVASHRSQFTKILKKDGFPALVEKMEARLAKGGL